MTGLVIAFTSAPNDIFTHTHKMWLDYMRKEDLCKLSFICKFKHSLNLSDTAYRALPHGALPLGVL